MGEVRRGEITASPGVDYFHSQCKYGGHGNGGQHHGDCTCGGHWTRQSQNKNMIDYMQQMSVLTNDPAIRGRSLVLCPS